MIIRKRILIHLACYKSCQNYQGGVTVHGFVVGTCDSYGQSGFITFDRADFSFSGNCTYVLAQTLENYIGQKFKVSNFFFF